MGDRQEQWSQGRTMVLSTVFGFMKSAKPDPVVTVAEERVGDLMKCVLECSDNARLTAQSLETACNSQRTLIKKLMSVWRSEEPENKLEGPIKAAFEDLSSEIPQKMLPVLKAHILQPLSEWAQELEILKLTGKTVEKEKIMLDHYEEKLLDLRQDTDKRRSKGKPESQKEIDKFQRNVEKHAEAEKVYEEARAVVVDKMNESLLSA